MQQRQGKVTEQCPPEFRLKGAAYSQQRCALISDLRGVTISSLSIAKALLYQATARKAVVRGSPSAQPLSARRVLRGATPQTTASWKTHAIRAAERSSSCGDAGCASVVLSN